MRGQLSISGNNSTQHFVSYCFLVINCPVVSLIGLFEYWFSMGVSW